MNKVIKASAGTGKTYRLSLEYLAALLNEIDFSEIIVMTFTKKATAEIKNRIFNHLRNILNQNSAGKEIVSSLKEIYPDLKIDRLKLEKIYKKMILNDEDIKIYTIDAFTNQIFSRGIAPYLALYNYQIIDDSQNEEIIEEILKIILNNKNYYQKLQVFLETTTARDTEAYHNFIKDIVNNAWKFMLLQSESKEKLPEADLVSLFEKTYQTLKNTAELRGEEFNSAYFVKAGRPFLEQYPELKKKSEKERFLYNRKDYLLNNSYWSGNKFRAKKTWELKEKLESEYNFFRKKLAVKIYNQEIIAAENEIISSADLILKLYDELKFKSGKFTHSDISNYTFKHLHDSNLDLIEAGKATDYLLDLLGGDYKALFIDEFQDTSILQWKILKPLIKKADTFIAVGDEKQSIYGWRGGEKKLFASLAEIIGAKTERLDCCYRSDKNIIKFLNNFFSKAKIDWEYHSVKAASNNSGLTEILYGGSSAYYNTNTKKFASFSEEKQEQIKKINQKIKSDLPAEIADSIKENYQNNYGEVNILARTANELEETAAALAEKNIPYILENSSSILEAALPAALNDFLYFAAYRDFYSLLKFMRSDLILLDNSQLKTMLQNQKELRYYFNSNQEEKFPAELSANNFFSSDLEQKLKEIQRVINLDYSEIIDYLYQKTALLKLAADNTLSLKNLYKFFEILNSFSSLKDLLNYLEEKKETEKLKQKKVENKDAVTLMTIHQAKGLSLPVEYFYWSPGRRTANNSNSLNFYLEFDENYQELKNYLFIEDKYLSVLDWLDYDFKEKEEKKKKMEEVNNLYVALSRAENNLHLYVEAPRKIKIDKKLLWQGSSYDYYEEMLLKGVKSEKLLGLLEKEKNGEKRTNNIESDPQDHQINALNKYIKTTKKTAAETDQKEEKKYRFLQKESKLLELTASKMMGLALHYYLENIKYNETEEKKSAEKLLKSKYGNLLGKEKINYLIKKADQFIVKNPECFSKKYQIFNEYLIKEKTDAIDAEDKYYRIDRLLVDEANKKIKIIDYKTGSYRDPEQLKKYKKILKKDIQDNWQIEAKFLFVL